MDDVLDTNDYYLPTGMVRLFWLGYRDDGNAVRSQDFFIDVLECME